MLGLEYITAVTIDTSALFDPRRLPDVEAAFVDALSLQLPRLTALTLEYNFSGDPAIPSQHLRCLESLYVHIAPTIPHHDSPTPRRKPALPRDRPNSVYRPTSPCYNAPGHYVRTRPGPYTDSRHRRRSTLTQ
ncbi:hypothetical protein BC938DRAFT_480011 [Jimgerdemannia flammicorona]|uniref:Uncharacterized protein n=1 Tax=Jimgerdemannia flammicorona TaxID=994334 RepID=A0A433QJN4_9FUNG|nr:hypothetical protein BC938DRAFT_480011 [Jimgerdemannia flammicorona]